DVPRSQLDGTLELHPGSVRDRLQLLHQRRGPGDDQRRIVVRLEDGGLRVEGVAAERRSVNDPEPARLGGVGAGEPERDAAPADVVRRLLVGHERALHRDQGRPGPVRRLGASDRRQEQHREREERWSQTATHGGHLPPPPLGGVTLTPDSMKFREAVLSMPRMTRRLPGGALVNCLIKLEGPAKSILGSAGWSWRRTWRPTNGSSFQVLNA